MAHETATTGTAGTDDTSLTSIAYLSHVVAFGKMVRDRTRTLVLNEKIKPKSLPLKDGDNDDNHVRNAYAFADYITTRPRPEHCEPIRTEDAVQWYLGHDVPRNTAQYLLLLNELQISPANGTWKLNRAGQPIHTKNGGKAFTEDDMKAYTGGADKAILSMACKLFQWRQSHLDALAAGKPVVPHDIPSRPAPTPVIEPKPFVARGGGKGTGSGNTIAKYNDHHTGPRAHDPYTQGDYATYGPTFKGDEVIPNPEGEAVLKDIAARTENFHEYLRVTRLLKGYSIKKLGDHDGVGTGTVGGWEIDGHFPHLNNLIALRSALFSNGLMEFGGEPAGDKLIRLYVKGKVNNARAALKENDHIGFSACMNEMPREYWIDAMQKTKNPDAWEQRPEAQRHPWHDAVMTLETRNDYVKAIRSSLPDPDHPIDTSIPVKDRLNPSNTQDRFVDILSILGADIAPEAMKHMESQAYPIDNMSTWFTALKNFLDEYNQTYPDTDFNAAYHRQTFNNCKITAWADRAANGVGKATANGRGGG